MQTVSKTSRASQTISIADLPNLLVGADTVVPTINGKKRYINFDNAASTPTYTPIVEAVTSFLRWYSNVHRGTGFKSQLASWAFEQSRDIVADFIGADLTRQVVIFTKNSTEAINKLAHRLPFGKDDIVLTTLMEHHSNELPWRRVARVVHVGLDPDGAISKDDFVAKLRQLAGKVRLVATTGASNVTGYINDLDFLARESHRAGAQILIDGAQLVPHRPVNMKPHDEECRIDYLVFSAHKMYAPFGTGVLVSDRETFEQGDPETVGGGVVDIVTLEDAYWTDLPEKEEAGTPDTVGVVALAKAIRLFQSLGWKAIMEHEAKLTAHALRKLKNIPGVILYGDTDPNNAANRLGVISLNIADVPHALAAAILNHEGAIGVRSGCFCAHLYVKALLKVSDADSKLLEEQILARDRSALPGTIRASFGLYNTTDEIDEFVEMIEKIASGNYAGEYELDRAKGEYFPKDYQIDFEEYFKL